MPPTMGPAPSRARRTALGLGLAGGTALLLAGCGGDKDGEEVPATEDLMREHGVLRRILVVYRETATLLRTAPDKLDAHALGAAATLFRDFGETYHETRLEEQHIFPQVQKAGGEAANLVATLLDQHRRGREITAWVLGRCATGKVATGDAGPMARALLGFSRMYEAHTAFEDTIVFQAWRKSLSKKQLDEAGDQFEGIEKAQFKGDGFDMAVDAIAEIERRLGLHDLARYGAPPPGAPPAPGLSG